MKLARGSERFIDGDLPAPWELEEAGTPAPHPFDAPPPRGKRHVLAQVETDEDGQYSLMLMGNTWAFRDKFDRCGITGGYVEGDSGNEYVRCLTGLSYDEESKDRIMDVFGDAGLCNYAVYLIDETENTYDPMVQWLLTLENVFRR